MSSGRSDQRPERLGGYRQLMLHPGTLLGRAQRRLGVQGDEDVAQPREMPDAADCARVGPGRRDAETGPLAAAGVGGEHLAGPRLCKVHFHEEREESADG